MNSSPSHIYASPAAAAAAYVRIRNRLQAVRAADYERIIPAYDGAEGRHAAVEATQDVLLEDLDTLRDLELVWSLAASTAGLQPHDFRIWYRVQVESVDSLNTVAKDFDVSSKTVQRACRRVSGAVAGALRSVGRMLERFEDVRSDERKGCRRGVHVYVDELALADFRRMHFTGSRHLAAAE